MLASRLVHEVLKINNTRARSRPGRSLNLPLRVWLRMPSGTLCPWLLKIESDTQNSDVENLERTVERMMQQES
jgi:hypothetical protein